MVGLAKICRPDKPGGLFDSRWAPDLLGSIVPQFRTSDGRAFPSTHWTLVFQASAADSGAGAALEELCRRYWRPIYAYLRQHGHAPADAEDYTQQFFAEVLADGTLRAACPAQGRLRTFLLAALRRSLADQTRYRHRKKRGDGVPPLSLDQAREEERFFVDPVELRDPEKIYLAAWVRSLVEHGRRRLRESYRSRAALYLELERYLDKEDDGASYRETATRLGITEVTVRVHVSRLRKRFAEILRNEVRQTVESDAEFDAELAWVLGALSCG
jgi:RNA polymerase sigma-70 factor (ECF subfamily)